MLRVESVTKRFGGLVALDNVSLSIDEPKIYGVIGPNGSGKTTLLNVITGVLKPNEGRVYFKEKEITSKPLYAIAEMGIGRTFQTPRIFPELTVEENILVATRNSGGVRSSVPEILELIEMKEVANVRAQKLGHGQRKLLELGRVVALNPELIFLDEPLAGLEFSMIRKVVSYISVLNNEMKKTIVVIEHNLEELMMLANKIFVMHHGQKIEEGESEQVKASKKVHQAYFGLD